MALWENKDYDAHASTIANAFSAGRGQNGASLDDLVEKTARDEGLVPEQVRRLARAANLQTWKVEFERLKTAGAPDRNVEFPLCNEAEVLHRLQGSASSAVKTALHGAAPASEFPDLADDMDDLRHPSPPAPAPISKTAAEMLEPLQVRPDMEVLKLRRLDEEFQIRTKQACEGWRTAMQDLLDMTRRLDWTTERAIQMEKSAVAMHGTSVVPEINALRRFKMEKLLVLDQAKLAALQDRLEARPSREVTLLKQAADRRQQWKLLDQAHEILQKKLAYFEGLLRGVA
jgi:hypothetical protein